MRVLFYVYLCEISENYGFFLSLFVFLSRPELKTIMGKARNNMDMDVKDNLSGSFFGIDAYVKSFCVNTFDKCIAYFLCYFDQICKCLRRCILRILIRLGRRKCAFYNSAEHTI